MGRRSDATHSGPVGIIKFYFSDYKAVYNFWIVVGKRKYKITREMGRRKEKERDEPTLLAG